jgi:hypothetical protein
MKPGFILINNAEFIQIDNQEETNKVTMKNLKLKAADLLANIRTPDKVWI